MYVLIVAGVACGVFSALFGSAAASSWWPLLVLLAPLFAEVAQA